MSLLTIDIGNTQTVLGLFQNDTLAGHWRIATSTNRSMDELGVLLVRLLDLNGFPASQISGAILASVVPPVTHLVVNALAHYIGIDPMVVEPGVRTGVRIHYENPKEVGADRIVNAVAAFHRCHGACLVVDFGTATTVDCVAENGDYLGGVITPGPRIALEALVARAAKLPKIDLEKPDRMIGQNTVESMQAGTFYGYLAMVDGLVGRIREAMPSPVRKVYATGGLASVFYGDSQQIDEIDPYLTLDGLRLVYEMNRG